LSASILADDVVDVAHFDLLTEGGRRGGSDPAIALPTFAGDVPLKDAARAAQEIVEARIIERVLKETKWKKVLAAERLQISRPTLDAKIAQYGLQRPGGTPAE
jgi:DNA-binding NtrC family response regulator